MAATRSMRLSALLHGIGVVPAALDCEITGIALDSRKVVQGDLFLACAGRSSDGRRYVADAVQRGAVAVLYEAANAPQLDGSLDLPCIAVDQLERQVAMLAARFHGEPARALRLIGVTGTNGKTTCTQLIAAQLQALGQRCGVIGTLGYGISGSELRSLGDGPGTTPDALRLQEVLAELREQGADTVVMEVSSHGLDQYRVDVDDFAVAVFTNLSRDHLDYHGSMEAYAAAKQRLFSGSRLQAAVVNLDDAVSAATAAQLAAAVDCLSWSLHNPAATVYAEKIEYLPQGLRLQLVTPWGRFSVDSPLLGEFNAANLLAALATVCACERGREGFDPAAVVAALGTLQPVRGRMQIVASRTLTVVVDYAHTPDGLEQALRALRQHHAAGRICCVVGCGGERDRGKRPLMAAVAERLADRVLLTSDNPRGEAPEAIIADMLAGLQQPDAAVIEANRARAIAQAIMEAADGDCVLLAGKGHEQYQEIAGQRLPFDDAAQARLVLALRGHAQAGAQA
jgi:UDP-N-acetylmuramoyl-L-alanyl-D-glutamate--2,6-diaminopimelate ligase